jgi:hypothetical protein
MTNLASEPSTAKLMAARFVGREGARALCDVMTRQALTEGKVDVAEQLSAAVHSGLRAG